MCTRIFITFIHDSPKLETVQISVKSSISKWTVVYFYSRIIYSKESIKNYQYSRQCEWMS